MQSGAFAPTPVWPRGPQGWLGEPCAVTPRVHSAGLAAWPRPVVGGRMQVHMAMGGGPWTSPTSLKVL